MKDLQYSIEENEILRALVQHYQKVNLEQEELINKLYQKLQERGE